MILKIPQCLSMPVYACLCLSMPVYACLCLSMPGLCLSMPVYACLCLSMPMPINHQASFCVISSPWCGSPATPSRHSKLHSWAHMRRSTNELRVSLGEIENQIYEICIDVWLSNLKIHQIARVLEQSCLIIPPLALSAYPKFIQGI